jgi:hypothetical protein
MFKAHAATLDRIMGLYEIAEAWNLKYAEWLMVRP